MRVVFDKDGYLKSWVLQEDGITFNSDREMVVPTPEDFDIDSFYGEFQSYHLVDGKLVKDETRQADLDAQKENEKKELTLNEKIALFVESLSVDEEPENKEGYEYKPYFDKDNLRFSWKAFKK